MQFGAYTHSFALWFIYLSDQLYQKQKSKEENIRVIIRLGERNQGEMIRKRDCRISGEMYHQTDQRSRKLLSFD